MLRYIIAQALRCLFARASRRFQVVALIVFVACATALLLYPLFLGSSLLACFLCRLGTMIPPRIRGLSPGDLLAKDLCR